MANSTLLKRTKLPVKINQEQKNLSLDEIMSNLSESDKATLLKKSQDIQVGLFRIKEITWEIGRDLAWMKNKLPHGRYIKWIEYYYGKDLPYSTSVYCRKVYETFKDCPEKVKYFLTEYLTMLIQNKFPDEALSLIQVNAERLTNEGLDKIKENFKSSKKVGINSNQFLRQTKEVIQHGIDLATGKSTYRINHNTRHSFELGVSKVLKELNQRAKELSGLYPFDPTSVEHKNLLSEIHEAIEGLTQLKREINGGDGIMKQISTEEGNQYISNN